MDTPDANRSAQRPLVTERFLREPLVEAHADELFQGLSDPALYSFIPDEPPPSIEQLRRRFRGWEPRRSLSGDEVWLNYAIRDRASSRVLGTLQATVLPGRFVYLAYSVFSKHGGGGSLARLVAD